MVERLRALAERPLDPRAARAVVVLAAAIFAGLAVLVALAGSELGRAPHARQAPAARSAPAAPPPPSRVAFPAKPRAARPRPHRHPAQDPQDRRGSAAARRAKRELADHRALQHVPYHQGGVAITLVGAAGNKAILRVSAPTLPAARRGWRAFLRRYGDPGSAYLPRFEARGGHRG